MTTHGFEQAGAARWISAIGLSAMLAVAPSVAAAQTADRDGLSSVLGRFIAGPRIGITVRDITADDAAAGSSVPRAGAVVQAVHADTPAAAAGFRAGDIVVSFDGEAVRSARQLTRLIEETPAGREVAVAVVRDGRRVELKVAPAVRQPDVVRPRPVPPGLSVVPRPRLETAPFVRRAPGRLGIGVQDLTTQLGKYFGAANGVLVTSVDDDTPARTAGLEAGDVITKFNGESVTGAADLRRRIAAASGRITLTVVRNRTEQSVDVDLGAAPSDTTRRDAR